MTSPARGLVPRWALLTTFAMPVLLTAGWLIGAAVQPPSYSPVHQTVSQLSGHAANHRWIMTGALFAVGACYLVSAVGLVGPVPARIGLVVAGLAAFGVALSPQPVHGSTAQHVAFTALGELAIAIWPALLIGRRSAPGIVLGARFLAAATALSLVLLIWLLVEVYSGGALGVAERLGSAVQVGWPAVVAIAVRRRASVVLDARDDELVAAA